MSFERYWTGDGLEALKGYAIEDRERYDRIQRLTQRIRGLTWFDSDEKIVALDHCHYEGRKPGDLILTTKRLLFAEHPHRKSGVFSGGKILVDHGNYKRLLVKMPYHEIASAAVGSERFPDSVIVVFYLPLLAEKYGVDPVWGFKGLSFWFTHPDFGERDARNALTRLNACLRGYVRLRVPMSETEKIPAGTSGAIRRERVNTKFHTLGIIIVVFTFVLSLSLSISGIYITRAERFDENLGAFIFLFGWFMAMAYPFITYFALQWVNISTYAKVFIYILTSIIVLGVHRIIMVLI